MRVWLYARLSNDDDPEMNSLLNQQDICRSYAEAHGYLVAGSSCDDNTSGMRFSRRGLDELTAAVEERSINAVIVKDLSRLGRHRTQTALYIDYLRQCGVRVLSVTEGIDTFREEDELTIGIRQLMNDFYTRDIGNKIRAGYRQKQREGMVITPPFGYWKDRNRGEIRINPEAAVTVQMIYSLYLQGCGLKEIARRLNEMGRKTPAQITAERIGRETQYIHKTRSGAYLWTYVSVKNILAEEAYTGVLNNHRAEITNGKIKRMAREKWFRHVDFYPIIIEQEEWEQVQKKLSSRVLTECGNTAKHRYAGLLKCRECGNVFTPVTRYWNGKSRVEYVCKGYHRSGTSYCSSHRIREEKLDLAVWEYVSEEQERRKAELEKLLQMKKMWTLRKPILDAHISNLQEKVRTLEQEIDDILMEKLRQKE